MTRASAIVGTRRVDESVPQAVGQFQPTQSGREDPDGSGGYRTPDRQGGARRRSPGIGIVDLAGARPGRGARHQIRHRLILVREIKTYLSRNKPHNFACSRARVSVRPAGRVPKKQPVDSVRNIVPIRECRRNGLPQLGGGNRARVEQPHPVFGTVHNQARRYHPSVPLRPP
jgi:hypothetical protein